MTVLSSVQSAAIRITGVKPAALYGSSDQFSQELAELANEAALDITQGFDWQLLTKKHVVTGDGTAIEHDLPVDYQRMPVNTRPYSSDTTWPMDQALDVQHWFEQTQVLPIASIPKIWIILGGKFQVFPALALGEEVTFYYVSNIIVSGGKTQFDTDTDSFLLPERLLTLSVIWRYKALKNLEYAEDEANYSTALDQAAARDRGARVLRFSSGLRRLNARTAYPWPLG